MPEVASEREGGRDGERERDRQRDTDRGREREREASPVVIYSFLKCSLAAPNLEAPER